MQSGSRVDIQIPRWYSVFALIFLVLFSVLVFTSLLEKTVSPLFIAMTILFFILAFSISIYQLVTGRSLSWLRIR